MMEHGSLIIKDLTGEWPVYPGHPLVVATAIMKVFPSFGEANSPTGNGWCAALGDCRIPGAGDHVGAAMRVLGLGVAGGSVDEMVLSAKRYWIQGGAGGHTKNIAAGTRQADSIEVHFREMAVSWMADSAAAARHPL